MAIATFATPTGKLFGKQLITMCLLLQHVFTYQIMPLDSKGDFLGCYLDLHEAKIRDIEGNHSSSECVESCHENYYRYAMLHLDGRCRCGNFLGDIKSNSACREFCKTKGQDCEDKNEISDVYSTAVRMNGPPRNFAISNVTDTNAVLTWDEPESHLTIENYKVVANVVMTLSRSQPSSYSWISLYSNDTYRVNIVSLHPGSNYNISVEAASSHFPGAVVYQLIETLIGEPDANPRAPTILSKDDTTMVIKMEPVYNSNGPVSSYLVVVIEANAVQAVQTENLKSYRQANADGISYYVAAELQPNRIDEPFIIGDSKVYGKYFNAPLQPDKNYHVMLGMVSKSADREFIVYSDTAGMHVDVIMSHMPHDNASESSTVVVLLSLAIVVISLLLVVGLIGFYFLRNRIIHNHRQRLNDNQELTIQGPMIDVENNGYIPEDELPSNSSSSHLQTLKERVWMIPSTSLRMDRSSIIGSGRFGHVYPGTVVTLTTKNDLQHIAIYCIPDKKLQASDKRAMLKDLDLLIKTSNHPHVINLIGTCDYVDSISIALEHSSGTLKEYLLQHRAPTATSFSTLLPSQVLDLAWCIAHGMQCLHDKNIVHRELCSMHIAIVNCNGKSIAKIAGFGLAKYYRNELVPNLLRYTAREIFAEHDYTFKCDVWSFAVILWEICALGATPYANLNDNELREKITKGSHSHMLAQLPYVYDTLYQVMLNCWQIDWDERPAFAELTQHIDFIRNEDCLSFLTYPGFQYERHCPDVEITSGNNRTQ